MRLRIDEPSRRREPDLTSLINVVFLILIFFIVAGSLRPFSARDIRLVKSQPDTAGLSAPASLIAHADGRLTYRGEAISMEALRDRLLRERGSSDAVPLTIVADARLNAKRLLKIVRAARGPGVGEISILTERPRQ